MRNEEGLEFHLHLKAGDVGRYVLLPGDPARCEKIAAYFEHAHFVAQNREFVTWTGNAFGGEGLSGFHRNRQPLHRDCEWKSWWKWERILSSAWGLRVPFNLMVTGAMWRLSPLPSAMRAPRRSTCPLSFRQWLTWM